MPPLNLIVNGQTASKSLIKSMIAGLNDKRVRTEKGGYLFKTSLSDKGFYLGILPGFNQGERNYHYNIELPGQPEFYLTGSLNPEGVFSILFIPKSPELSHNDKMAYKELYQRFAVNFLEWGFQKPGPLDQVTRMLLETSGILEGFSVPYSLSDLIILH